MEKLKNHLIALGNAVVEKHGFVPLEMSIYYDEKKQKWSKHPPTKDWQSTTMENWKENIIGKNKNIGILTGKVSGVSIIDIDNKDDTMKIIDELENKNGKIHTLTVNTPSGGKHYYFKYNKRIPTAKRIMTVDKKKLNVDGRNDGGCVALPPSGYDKKNYQWVDENAEIVKCPEWMLKLISVVDEDKGYFEKNENKFMDILEDGGQLEIAQYFKEHNGNNVMYSQKDKTFYIYDDSVQIWRRDNDFKTILFTLASFIQNNIRNEIQKALNDKKNKETARYAKLLTRCTRVKFVKEIVEYCQRVFENEKEIEQLDENRHLLSFKNGVYDLKEKEFRERAKDDFLTTFISYDYSTHIDKKIQKEIETIIKHIANDDDDDYKSLLAYSGYSLTGETSKQKFLNIIGHTASNGKSTFMNILCQALEAYAFKPATETFDKNYTKAHKQFTNMRKPVRLVFIDEIDQGHLSTKKLKTFVDGVSVAGNEIMYGTSEDIKLHCKLVITSNFDPRFQTDNGILRRGYLAVLTNRFLDKDDFEKEKKKKGVYLKDQTLLNKFKQTEYKLALMQFLIPYAEQYFEKGLDICEKWTTQFKEIADNNDTLKQYIENNIVITGNDKDRIHKDEFLQNYNHYTGEKASFAEILSDLKRLGIKYDREKKINTQRGCIMGVKFNVIEINTIENKMDDDEQNTNQYENGVDKTSQSLTFD